MQGLGATARTDGLFAAPSLSELVHAQATAAHRPKASPRRMLLPETLPGWDTRPPTRSGRARPPPWAALTEAVAELMDGMWCGKQRLFVRHFVFQAGARRMRPQSGLRKLQDMQDTLLL